MGLRSKQASLFGESAGRGKARRPAPIRLIIGNQASAYEWLPLGPYSWRAVDCASTLTRARRPTQGAILLYPDGQWHAAVGSGEESDRAVGVYASSGDAMRAVEDVLWNMRRSASV